MFKSLTIKLLLLAFLLSPFPARARDWEVTGLGDLSGNAYELRIGTELNELWTAGIVGQYYTSRIEGRDYGLGAYAKLAVDPNGSVAFASWLPALGDLLDLPESLNANTYILAKMIILAADGETAAVFGIGPSAIIGPITIEWIYNIVDGGQLGNPALSSKAIFNLGMTFTF